MPRGVTHIVMAETLPESGDGCYAHYHHKLFAQASWTSGDIRAVIGQHQEEWLDQIDAWYGELSDRAAARTPWWWLLPGSRMTVWAPVDCKPLLFALAVIEVCTAARPGRMYLLECPDEVAEYLEEWSRHRQAGDSVVLTREGPRRRPEASRRHVRRTIGAFRALASLVMRMVQRGRVPFPIAPADLIVFSWALSARNLEQVGDHYFGRGLDDSERPLTGRVAWLYALGQAGERKRIRRYCESIGRRIMFTFELLRWPDVPAIIRDCVRLAWTLRTIAPDVPELRVGALCTREFGRRFWETAVAWQWPVDEFAVHRAMTRYLAAVGASSVIYPYEEKGVERAILTACLSREPPVTVVAFAHAAYNRGHRSVRRTHAAGRPTPHAVATTGPAAAMWLVKWASLPPAQAVAVGSPRFARSGDAPAPSGGRRVLFLVGYGFEVGLLVRFVEQQPNLFDGYDLVIRRYPHAWQADQDRWLEELRGLGVQFTVDAGTMYSQIAAADIVIFNSTSAGIESMLQGRATIHVALHDVVDVDPFQGQIAHPAVLSCATPLALRDTLSALSAFSPSQYASLVEAQRAFAETVYARFDPSAVARVLSSPRSCDVVRLSNAPQPASSTPVCAH